MSHELKRGAIVGAFAVTIIYFHYFPIFQPADNKEIVQVGELPVDPPVEDSLVKVNFIFRHGDRGPLGPRADLWPPTSQSDEWPDGWEELTKLGKKNAYLLGKRLRNRYDTILTPHYKKSNFRAVSTGLDRALMSANLVMAGLYPPQDHQKWSDDIDWTPIPVRPSGMSGEFFKCPRMHYEAIKLFREMGPNHWKPCIDFLHEKSDLKIRNLEDPTKELLFVFDQASAKMRNKKSLETWEKEFVTFAADSINSIYKNTVIGSDVQRQLASNPLGNYVIAALKSDNNVTMYSSHDIQLYLMSAFLGFNLEKPPLPTSCIATEVHRRPDGSQIVKAFYFTEAMGEMKQIEIHGEKELPWEKFESLASQIGKEEYDELCNSTPQTVELERNENDLIKFLSSLSKQV